MRNCILFTAAAVKLCEAEKSPPFFRGQKGHIEF